MNLDTSLKCPAWLFLSNASQCLERFQIPTTEATALKLYWYSGFDMSKLFVQEISEIKSHHVIFLYYKKTLSESCLEVLPAPTPAVWCKIWSNNLKGASKTFLTRSKSMQTNKTFTCFWILKTRCGIYHLYSCEKCVTVFDNSNHNLLYIATNYNFKLF